ncbi:MAG: molybdate ABC transporter substrate-binding protein [Desulfomonilaceae bacterium]
MFRFFLVPILVFVCQISAFAEPLILAAGAGYKRPMSEIIQAYQSSGGDKIDQIYGNMGQIMMQAKAGGKTAFIVGDEAFLKTSGIDFESFHQLGEGTLVIAFGKKVKLDEPKDLLKAEIVKVAVPDEKNAIYGKAAKEFLHKTDLMKGIEKKLLVVSTVPQVSAYLISGDVEAGFINLTDALYIKDKIGGYLTLDRSTYSPIKLTLGVIKGYGDESSVKRFLNFLDVDPKVKEIIKKAGM